MSSVDTWRLVDHGTGRRWRWPRQAVHERYTLRRFRYAPGDGLHRSNLLRGQYIRALSTFCRGCCKCPKWDTSYCKVDWRGRGGDGTRQGYMSGTRYVLFVYAFSDGQHYANLLPGRYMRAPSTFCRGALKFPKWETWRAAGALFKN